MIDQIKYNILLDKLREAKTWLNKLGISTDNTRFDEIVRYIGLINEAYTKNKLDDLIEKLGNEIMYYSLTESRAFVDIYNAFYGNIKSDKMPREALKISLGGPFVPREENAVTNEARNRLFELQLAALFINKGIQVYDFKDISCIFNSYKLHIQCKRPLRAKNVFYNSTIAYNQLKPFLNDGRDRGIIALSIEKIVGMDDKIIHIYDERRIDKEIGKIVDPFMKEYRASWKFIDTKVIAVFVVIKFISHIKSINLLTSGFLVNFLKLCSNESLQFVDNQLLQDLHDKLH